MNPWIAGAAASWLAFAISRLIRGLELALNDAWRELAEGARRTIDAFPNPIKMLNEALWGITGFSSRLLTAGARYNQQIVMDALKASGLGARLIRLDRAAEGVFEAHNYTFGELTFTGRNDLLGWIVGALARASWALFKDFSFLLKLLKVKDVEEFVDLVVRSFQRRVGLYRLIGTFVAIVWAVFDVAATVVTVSVLFGWPEIQKRLLPQDAPRFRAKLLLPNGSIVPVRPRLNQKEGPEK